MGDFHAPKILLFWKTSVCKTSCGWRKISGKKMMLEELAWTSRLSQHLSVCTHKIRVEILLGQVPILSESFLWGGITMGCHHPEFAANLPLAVDRSWFYSCYSGKRFTVMALDASKAENEGWVCVPSVEQGWYPSPGGIHAAFWSSCSWHTAVLCWNILISGRDLVAIQLDYLQK